MRINLRVVLCKLPPAVCLLAFAAVLAGCNSTGGGRILPYGHNVSLGSGGPLVSPFPYDLRHHGRPVRVAQPHHHNHP
ncbi:hypothetical protein BH10ACI4_BH10ACI4_39060 [soil metagenome]